MKKLISFFKINKFKILILILIITIALSIGIPSLARYKNRVNFIDTVVWDGSTSSSYKSGSGTNDDPYIISNGSELAYLASSLIENSYKDCFFKLSGDIILNEGIFSYDTSNGGMYILDDTTYYIKENTNEYYQDVEKTNLVGTINEFKTLSNFEGTFIGDSYTIYGLYMNRVDEEVALFSNLKGTVKELYVENSYIQGGNITAGIASTMENAAIENLAFSGNVIGNVMPNTKDKTIILDDTIVESSGYIKIHENILGTVNTSSLTGSVVLENTTLDQILLYINGVRVENEIFEIDLGTNKYSEVSVLVVSDNGVSVSLENLCYSVNYSYSLAGGISAKADNSSLKNVINKANIYGALDAAGIITYSSNISLVQTYNKGNINADNIAGLLYEISYSTEKVSILNSYNSSSLNGLESASIVNKLFNNTLVSITNVFSTDDNYFINSVLTSTVNINNSYSISTKYIKAGEVNGTILNTTYEELIKKTFGKGTLSFYEFVDLNDLNNNSDNVWVYTEEELPILYIDDLINPIASIHAGTYSWNSLGYKLRDMKFNTSIMYGINELDNLKPLKEIYYYIHNSKNPLMKTEIEDITSWEEYTGVSEITEQGFYIIYAKVIDYNDNISYLNSDLLILDLSGSNVEISFSDNIWKEYSDTLKYSYISKPENVKIEAYDELSGLDTLEYIISDSILSLDELKEVTTWITYKNEIVFSDVVPKIIYVKAVDNCEFVTYANSDYILLNGYTQENIIIGKNTISSGSVYITDKSKVTLNFNYIDNNKIAADEEHSIISNILLPENTELRLYDNNSKKIYSYVTTNADLYGYSENGYATYKLSMFKNASIFNKEEYFDESKYNGDVVNDSFKLIIDFLNTEIVENINNLEIEMAITKNNKIERGTIISSKKSFNVYSNVEGENTSNSLYIESSYNGDAILLNSNSSLDVNITTGLKGLSINSNKIYDTLYENKIIGLLVKIVDSSGNQINKRDINNLLIELDGNEYAPDLNGTFRFSLNNGINTSVKTLKIKTEEDNIKISSGIYYLKISSFAAYDGVYASDGLSNEITIPITVSTNQINIDYSFNVECDESARIISKNELTKNVNFEIYVDGAFTNPNVRVTLYKKEKITAYDQNYVAVNLKNYTENSIVNISDFSYYASENIVNGVMSNFELSLLLSKFDNTGYKFVFELYDGDTKIGIIEKKFIVR